jgi:hypothetical protein
MYQIEHVQFLSCELRLRATLFKSFILIIIIVRGKQDKNFLFLFCFAVTY